MRPRPEWQSRYLGRAGVSFESIACPEAFRRDPRLAWGFYGHRLKVYRRTDPHEGFQILRRWAANLEQGAFVATSNVDAQFQKAGFTHDRIDEFHGSIHHLQCLDGCCDEIWPADGFVPVVDEENCKLVSDLPTCPHCGNLARPNIAMFGDWEWAKRRERQQAARLGAWLQKAKNRLVIEIGAGTDIPTVRRFSEAAGGTLIRINPTQSRVPWGRGWSIAAGGLAALREIDGALTRLAGGAFRAPAVVAH